MASDHTQEVFSTIGREAIAHRSRKVRQRPEARVPKAGSQSVGAGLGSGVKPDIDRPAS